MSIKKQLGSKFKVPFTLPLAFLRIPVYKGKGAGWALGGSKWSWLESNYGGGNRHFPVSWFSYFSWNSSGFEYSADPTTQDCFCDGETLGISYFMCPQWIQSIHPSCPGGRPRAQPSGEMPVSCRPQSVLVCLAVWRCHVHLSRLFLYDSLYTTWKEMKRFIRYREESGQEREHEAASSPRSQVPFWFLRRFIFSISTPLLFSGFVQSL